MFSIFSVLYLQYIEHTVIYNILVQNHILGYFWYVDNILLVYNTYTTDIYTILDNFNSATPTMQFTNEEEQNDSIYCNCFDITIYKGQKPLHIQHLKKAHCHRQHHPPGLLPPHRAKT
jgi:hypothetical protein